MERDCEIVEEEVIRPLETEKEKQLTRKAETSQI